MEGGGRGARIRANKVFGLLGLWVDGVGERQVHGVEGDV